jgi:hypothetical protein
MILSHSVLDSSVGPYEFEVRIKDGHVELCLPGMAEPFIVTTKSPIRFSIHVPGEPRPIRMKAWLMNPDVK